MLVCEELGIDAGEVTKISMCTSVGEELEVNITVRLDMARLLECTRQIRKMVDVVQIEAESECLRVSMNQTSGG